MKFWTEPVLRRPVGSFKFKFKGAVLRWTVFERLVVWRTVNVRIRIVSLFRHGWLVFCREGPHFAAGVRRLPNHEKVPPLEGHPQELVRPLLQRNFHQSYVSIDLWVFSLYYDDCMFWWVFLKMWPDEFSFFFWSLFISVYVCLFVCLSVCLWRSETQQAVLVCQHAHVAVAVFLGVWTLISHRRMKQSQTGIDL